MELIEISASDFDLEKTLDSGQVFHWEKRDGGFVGAIGDRAVYTEQRGDAIVMEGGAPATPGSRELAPPLSQLVERYFSLDHPLAEICASFPDDAIMGEARRFCAGLRIIRQPRWECLATFICSSMKQVAHIRQISFVLRRRYGHELPMGIQTVFTFPSAERLAACSEPELRACALGYRAKNLLATARLVSSGQADLDAWSALPDDELRDALCQLPGVGAKVANCVMLFAFERLRAFPIDVWIRRALQEAYFPRARKLTAERLRAFSQKHFGEHGGYAQQYLFHYMRRGRGKSSTGRDSSILVAAAPGRNEGSSATSEGNLSGRASCDNISPPGNREKLAIEQLG